MVAYTANLRLAKPDFNAEGWDTLINANSDVLDAFLGQFNTGLTLQGVWLNSTLYAAGVAVVDSLTGHIWYLNTSYTTSPSPVTFAADRASFPTYWTDVTNPAITAAISAASAAASVVTAASSASAASVSAATATAAVAAGLVGVSAITGLTLSNDGGAPLTTLGISAGMCSDSTKTVLITLGTFTKKTSGTWVAGNAANGMGVALTIANSTWYHVFAVKVAGVDDVYFDTSVTAANKPVGTTAFRRLGSFVTDGSAHPVLFIQTGNQFDWLAPVVNFNTTSAVTTAVSLQVTVPLGVVCQALLSGTLIDASADSILYLSSLAQTDVAASSTTGVTGDVKLGGLGSFHKAVVTNASQQVRRRSSSTTQAITCLTDGYIDYRGTNI